jgi:hypothetical protein
MQLLCLGGPTGESLDRDWANSGGLKALQHHYSASILRPFIARFPPISPISLKIGEVHRKANFSETQVDFLAGKIDFLVRTSKIKIAPYS